MAPINVLITGANSGVGFATAKVLATAPETFNVIMTGRSLEKVNSAMQEIKKDGITGSLEVQKMDVTDGDSIERAVKYVEEKYGHLDVLVNNAGVAPKDDDIKNRMQVTMDTNVVGPAVVAEAFRPLLLKAAKPYSIFVSSAMGSFGYFSEGRMPPNRKHDAYRSSKAALNMIALGESKVFGAQGLNVFAMCPGLVVSNLRGTSEEARNGIEFGGAGDPLVAGKTILSIIRGERDSDVGKFVHKDGVYPW